MRGAAPYVRAATRVSTLLALFAGNAHAEEPAKPPPGSPAATTTIDGRHLPPPPPAFGGTIARDAAASTPWWPPRVVPPEGAPNILLILTDDVGFGAPSTFGGVIPTPALDRVASAGLRYTQFHSTALCSPTRAALLTGRNHHSAGFGVITEQATGYPGYDSILAPDTATIGRILQEHGYATAWFGKNHNTPAFEASQAGPFDRWPTGLGFDYFYGFVGGDTSQWQPNLYRNTTAIHPYVDNPGWNLTTAMADDAIEHLRMLHQVDPDKPFFVHYAPGGSHAPHHAPPEWIAKFRGRFDSGWNALREEIYTNQKRLGVIPPDAELTPWPSDLLPEWDTLTAEQKKLYARQAEVYAAYLAYTDYEIGRVIQAVEDLGELDDTLIVYISGDNGASAEGTMVGTPNEVAMFNGMEIPVEEQLARYYDVWGSDRTYNHMATPWAWAFNTPFRWTKQIASHFGGTRQGVAIAWPKRITDRGGVRGQFHHVVDIVPTLLEVTGIQAPETVDGIAQRPIEGVSMAYTFDAAAAEAPSTRVTQYFEMYGDRAIYHDGWIASTTPLRPAWVTHAPAIEDPADAFAWELYDLRTDWTQNHDLAASNPEKLAELQALFWEEAARYRVLPLDASMAARLVTPRPSLAAGRTRFAYAGEFTGLPIGDAPSLLDTSYTITADVEVPEGGAEGMLVTAGGRFGGYGFYVLDGRPVFVWNYVDRERPRWEAKEALSPGRHTLQFEFTYEGAGAGTLAYNDYSGVGRGGTGVLRVDGQVVDTRSVARTLGFAIQWNESFDVGADTGTPVDDADYRVPFRFTGTLANLTVELRPPVLTPEERERLEGAPRGTE